MTICSVCGKNQANAIPYINDWNHILFDGKKIMLCAACGFGNISPPVDKDKLEDYYKTIYRSKDSPKYVNLSKNPPPQSDARALAQLSLAQQFLKRKEKGTISFLDIGVGMGASLCAAKYLFDKVVLHVAEKDLNIVSYLEKFLAIKTINDYLSRAEQFDVILMSHSLEHFDILKIPDFLNDIYNILKPGGVILMEVPNIDFRESTNMMNRKSDTPHLCFFSKEALEKICVDSPLDLVFINTTGAKKTKAHFKVEKKNPVKSALRYIVRTTLSITGLINLIRQLRRLRNNPLENHNFKYGGDSPALRVVLRKALMAGVKK